MTSTAEGEQAPHSTGLADQPENTDESPLVSMAFKGQDRIVVSHWDGLLPSPENMAAYAKVSPDLPDKILQLAISEFQFQQELEKRRLKHLDGQ